VWIANQRRPPRTVCVCDSPAMGVLGRRHRGDSRASLHRPISAEHVAPDTLDALAEPSSFPRTLGSEPVSTGGTSYRTPSRSFYHRSFHNVSGTEELFLPNLGSVFTDWSI
jgi:hypothetical protein